MNGDSDSRGQPLKGLALRQCMVSRGEGLCLIPLSLDSLDGWQVWEDTRRKEQASYTSVYAIRLPANQVIQEQIPLLERPTEWPSRESLLPCNNLPRRVVASQGELFPRVGFIVTISYPPLKPWHGTGQQVRGQPGSISHHWVWCCRSPPKVPLLGDWWVWC